MTRTLLLLLVLAGYASVFLRLPAAGARAGFDPLSPEGRHVEQSIEMRRFAEALPVAIDLERAHPDNLTIAYWMVEIHDGLKRAGDAARARGRYLGLLDGRPADSPR